MGDCSTHHGIWYAPAAKQAKNAADAAARAANGVSAKGTHAWASGATERRKAQRKASAQQKKAAAVAAGRRPHSDGDSSDDSMAPLRSAVARMPMQGGATSSVTFAPADAGTPAGPADLC